MYNGVACSPEMEDYFRGLADQCEKCYIIAGKCRGTGRDIHNEVEIPIAIDLAQRVEEVVGPVGIAETIRKMANDYPSREVLSLMVAKKLAEEFVGNKRDALDQAVRTGLAILTEGVLVAPTEGIAEVGIGKNDNGTDYCFISYAGPIRSGGGTGQALSLLIADIVRRALKIGKYIPTDREVFRYKEEIPLANRESRLQYFPSSEEIELIVRHCPVCIDGEGTGKLEISGNRDLPRIETNKVRGGMALVLAEGLCQKASKIQKYVKSMKLEDWEFIDKFVKKKGSGDSGEVKIKPNNKYFRESLGGRPVISEPSKKGGFRLRYGRGRTCGLATIAIHPSAMYLLDEYIALATQIKIERPGKAGAVTPNTNIECPIVLMKNGDLREVEDPLEAKAILDDIESVEDLGEMLVPYGEFAENNHVLMPGAFSVEWWRLETAHARSLLAGTIEQQTAIEKKLEKDQATAEKKLKAEKKTFTELDEKAASGGCGPEELKKAHASLKKAEKKTESIEKKLFRVRMEMEAVLVAVNIIDPKNAIEAANMATQDQVPLHPRFNLFWHDISTDDIIYLTDRMKDASMKNGRLLLPVDPGTKEVIVDIAALHTETTDGYLIDERYSYPIIRCTGFDLTGGKLKKIREPSKKKHTSLTLASELAGFPLKARGPARIGSRMGRPEKAEMRKMKHGEHILFPTGGGVKGKDRAICSMVGKETSIETAGYVCPFCSTFNLSKWCTSCKEWFKAEPVPAKRIRYGIYNYSVDALARLGKKEMPKKFKGVLGMMSAQKIPEPLEKGILRASRDLPVFKDGTIRFDMMNITLTHFKPKEIGTPPERLREMGYTHDIYGKVLKDKEQILEIKVQDVIPATTSGDHLLGAAKFADELMEKFYEQEPYYNCEKREDLVGHLVIGLAPHTSAGVLARVIGFSDISGCYGHPYYHAAKRRNCDGDEDAIMLLLESLLNFSRHHLSENRGGTMDAPLVLTTHLNPKEIDKEALNVDLLSRYPLYFFRATEQYLQPKELETYMDTVSTRIGTPEQYCGFGFTHDTEDINMGPTISRYKIEGIDMKRKVADQLKIYKRLRGIDENTGAALILESHFLKDIYSTMVAYSRQGFRCPRCGEKFRRMPLVGNCQVCGGNIILTIHPGGVVKYQKIAAEIIERYKVSPYTRERFSMIEEGLGSLFDLERLEAIKAEKEKKKKRRTENSNMSLTDFF